MSNRTCALAAVSRGTLTLQGDAPGIWTGELQKYSTLSHEIGPRRTKLCLASCYSPREWIRSRLIDAQTSAER